MSKIINGELHLSKKTLGELMKSVMERGIPFRIKAPGNSMSPLIRNGDIITISPLKGHRPGCGDVLAFVSGPKKILTVHRMVKKKGNFFHFRGDNSLGAAEIVSGNRLIGRLSEVERNGEKIHFGLGPERVLIGYLNRNRGFAFMVRAARQLSRLIKRRTI